jgi:hypothetical protein
VAHVYAQGLGGYPWVGLGGCNELVLHMHAMQAVDNYPSPLELLSLQQAWLMLQDVST